MKLPSRRSDRIFQTSVADFGHLRRKQFFVYHHFLSPFDDILGEVKEHLVPIYVREVKSLTDRFFIPKSLQKMVIQIAEFYFSGFLGKCKKESVIKGGDSTIKMRIIYSLIK